MRLSSIELVEQEEVKGGETSDYLMQSTHTELSLSNEESKEKSKEPGTRRYKVVKSLLALQKILLECVLFSRMVADVARE